MPRPLLLLPLLLLAACGEPEPVLSGIEPPGEPASRDGGETGRPYRKPEGVYVDVRHFGGRSFDAVQAELVAQMGPVLEQRELGPREGTEYRFERGVVRVVRGTIYMLRVELPRPMTRTEALEATGFPTYSGEWIAARREFRLGYTWGFRRLRLKREEVGADRVVELEAWKEAPERVGP